jgi:hypothetical protein
MVKIYNSMKYQPLINSKMFSLPQREKYMYMITVQTEMSLLRACSAHLFLGCAFEYLIGTCYLKTIPPMEFFNLFH